MSNFKELMVEAKEEKSGATVLIQAAPGAGKTALLTECARLAGRWGWMVAEVEPGDLLDPKALHESIRSSWQDWLSWLKRGSAGINLGVFNADVEFGREESTPLGGLKKGSAPLLLLLDEAQNLADIPRDPRDQFMAAKTFLKAIHAGKVGRPVILMAAGLGATTEAFERLGISRFEGDCHINLGPLKQEDVHAVLRDWLKKGGRAEGDPTSWIDTIAKETHGWPQHIMAYVKPVMKHLADKKNQKRMTPEGLQAVLTEGRERRAKFYTDRGRGFQGDELHCIARVLARVSPGTGVAQRDIITSLSLEYDHDTAGVLFRRALHKGILDERDNRYVVPIPSMHTWLVDNFARIQEPSFSPPHSLTRPMGFDSRGRGIDR